METHAHICHRYQLKLPKIRSWLSWLTASAATGNEHLPGFALLSHGHKVFSGDLKGCCGSTLCCEDILQQVRLIIAGNDANHKTKMC